MSERKKIELSADSYLDLLNQIYQNQKEERDLALDRYRIQDEQIDSPEKFILQGKTLSSFLGIAAQRTDSLSSLAKEIKDIVFKSETNNSGAGTTGGGMTEELRRKILDEISKSETTDPIDETPEDGDY